MKRPPPLPPPKRMVNPPVPSVQGALDNSSRLWLIVGIVGAMLLAIALLVALALLSKPQLGDAGEPGSGDQIASSKDILLGSGSSSANESASSSKTDTNPTADNSADTTTAESQPDPESSSTAASQEPGSGDGSNPQGTGDGNSDQASVTPPEPPKNNGRVIPIYDPGAGGMANSSGKLEANGENPFLSIGDEASIIYVIDKSSSMANGSLDRVRSALIEAIDRLDRSQKFQVIFFDTSMQQNPSGSGLLAAGKTNKQQTIQWIQSVVPSGGTNPLQAMLEAINAKPERIILLSDGEFDPSYVDQITAHNQSVNRRPIRIDCIGLNEVVLSLQQIAQSNGPGVYYQAR